MDIDKFAGEHCDFCDYETPKLCLSCMKTITYEAIKDGVNASMPFSLDIKDTFRNAILDAFPYPSEIRDAIYGGCSEIKG